MLERLLFMLPFSSVAIWMVYIVIRTELVYYRDRQVRKIAESQDDRKAVPYDPDDLVDIAAVPEAWQDLTRSKAFEL